MKEIHIAWFILHLVHICTSDKNDYRFVTCGSILKLYNSERNAYLHSHDIKYQSGNMQSGHQSVSGNSAPDEHRTYWKVKAEHDGHCKRGYVIKCGDVIRLEHTVTKRNLHSHNFLSPLTHQQEVSAFGENGNGDSDDNWTVTCPYRYWSRKDEIRLQHVNSGAYLDMGYEQYDEPIRYQYEVCGTMYAGQYSNYWLAREGVFPKGIVEKMTSSSETAFNYELGCSALHCRIVIN